MQTEQKIDLHNGEARNFSARKRLEESEISKEDKKAISRFIDSISASENLSPVRESKLMDEIRKVRIELKKTFAKVNKPDLEKFILKINKSGLSLDTQKDYRMILKRFIKWYHVELGRFENVDRHSYPPIVAWIHEPRKETNRNSVIREVLLEEEDALKIINACKEPMWKAMLWILWEAGLRPGELLNLRCRDIESTENGIRVNVRFGKTGARKLPLVQAKQSVLIWKDMHPNKDKYDAPLFPILHGRNAIIYSLRRIFLLVVLWIGGKPSRSTSSENIRT